jgi:glycosyltransferase involved in cell wall biosynthesis
MGSDVTAIVTCMTDAERPFIREALQSVRDQTLPCEETIVVVLESNTWIDDIVADFPHIKVMRRPPGWEGASRHTAIDAARTEFVAFLDGDDVWLPTKTSKQVELLRHGRGDLVGADYIMTTEEGKPFAYGLCRYQAPPSTWMVRRETMVRYPLDPNLPLYVDWSWWVNTRHTVRKCRLPEQLMKYRVRRQSLSSPVPDKRRKLALSNLSSIPTARPLILATTYALYRLNRRGHYLAPKVLTQGSHSTAT